LIEIKHHLRNLQPVIKLSRDLVKKEKMTSTPLKLKIISPNKFWIHFRHISPLLRIETKVISKKQSKLKKRRNLVKCIQ